MGCSRVLPSWLLVELLAASLTGGCSSQSVNPCPCNSLEDCCNTGGGGGVGGGSGGGGSSVIGGGGGSDVWDAGADAGSDAGPTHKKIFTSVPHNGNFGGIQAVDGGSGADSFCMGAPNKPDSHSYRAMLVDGTHRAACATGHGNGACLSGDNIDWVLAPTRTYYRADGTTVIGTTNAAGIFEPGDGGVMVLNSLGDGLGSDGGFANQPFTGMEADWTAHGYTCTNFSNAGEHDYTTAGSATSLTGSAIGGGVVSCAELHSLYCVEQ